MDLSVVVPVFNERENLGPLYEELTRELSKLGRSYELLFIDDGSTDGGADVLKKIKSSDAHLRILRLARNSGQTAALACGLKNASGAIVVAIDADGENDPADIAKLVSTLEQGYDLVSGWREQRWNSSRVTRRFPSLIFNRIISGVTGVRLHDYGCTLKAYRRDLAQRLLLYGEMHRFVPAIAAEFGATITEVPVSFRPRRAGRSKYGLGRVIRASLDLLTVLFLSSFSTRPIQVFGLIGVVLGSIGGIWTALLLFEKIALGYSLGNRPALLLAVLLVVVGVQFVSLGLLGEMLARTYHESQNKPPWVVKEEF